LALKYQNILSRDQRLKALDQGNFHISVCLYQWL